MGTWKADVLSDDFALDVYDTFLEDYNSGKDPRSIRKTVEAAYAEALDDPDDGPVFWLALACVEWECGLLEKDVLGRVTRIIKSGKGLDRWKESGAAALKERQKVLREFLGKINKPSPRPRKPKKKKIIRPVYEPGDCLAIKLSDEDYGAAIVLAAMVAESTGEGHNLVGVLRYKSPQKPSREVFEARKWLILTHHSYENDSVLAWCSAVTHKGSSAEMLERVDHVTLRKDDPKDGGGYRGWNFGIDVILQDKWDRGIRD